MDKELQRYLASRDSEQKEYMDTMSKKFQEGIVAMSKYEGAERDATPESLAPDIRAGIAKYLYNLERGKFTETNTLYKYQWAERAEYAPINEKLELIRAEYRHKADQILAYLKANGWGDIAATKKESESRLEGYKELINECQRLNNCIEQARREERERIIDLAHLHGTLCGNDPKDSGQCESCKRFWQALKGEQR